MTATIERTDDEITASTVTTATLDDKNAAAQQRIEDRTLNDAQADLDAILAEDAEAAEAEAARQRAGDEALAASRAMPAEARLLGFEVNWSVTGTLIDRDALSERLTEGGFAEFVPKREPTAKKALRRAIAEWAGGRSGQTYQGGEDDPDTGGRQKKLIREVRGAAAVRGQAAPTILALVNEASLTSELSLKYALAYRFSLTPPEGTSKEWRMRVSLEERGAFAYGEYEGREEERARVEAEVKVAWDKHKNLYSGADVSQILRDIVHDGLAAVSVEAGSGVWFVPADYATQVDSLERLVKGLAGVSASTSAPHLRVRENIDWPRTRAALADAAKDDLLAELRAADQELLRFETQNAEKPGSVKITTVKGLIAQFLAVKKKAEFYADTVGMRQERLSAELDKFGQRALVLARSNRNARVAPSAPTITPAVARARGQREF